MIGYTFKINLELLERLRAFSRENHISMGLIIRRLLERYLDGEIGLD